MAEDGRGPTRSLLKWCIFWLVCAILPLGYTRIYATWQEDMRQADPQRYERAALWLKNWK